MFQNRFLWMLKVIFTLVRLQKLLDMEQMKELMKRRIKKAECFKAYFIVYVKNCYILVIVDLKMYRFGG